VLNLGGIANATLLDADAQHPVRGFDTGPANVLLDAWITEKKGLPFDADGAWARTGTSSPALLAHLLASEHWLSLPPPKSTGRDMFNSAWLHNQLQAFRSQGLSDADIQATLVDFTAHSAAQAILAQAPETQEVLVCGGGAKNPCLMAALHKAMN